ncbi:uncharacterized protein [Palaemon carinicauda]|uniref:uncharacterized protein n=1 Tax=Palaemon carinicauda TaxID=392227 RepID=UPI0035B5762A
MGRNSTIRTRLPSSQTPELLWGLKNKWPHRRFSNMTERQNTVGHKIKMEEAVPSPPRVTSTQSDGEEKREEEKYERDLPRSPSASLSSVSIAVSTDDLIDCQSEASVDDEPSGQPSTTTGRPQQESENREGNAKGSPRICGVCGDKAKSMHFGGLSCDSCKAFFRRAVHNDAYVNFTCPYDGNCVINVVSRKCCQFCRYKKCTSIGMERAWVMSEEDRAQMMKQREERKSKKATPEDKKNLIKTSKREIQPYEPDMGAMLDYMTVKERDEVERAVLNYRRAYSEVPYRNDLKEHNVGRPSVQIINMFTTVVRRFAYFARFFPEFCNLPAQDQGCLLRGGILEMSLIRGVQSYDTENNRWPNTNHQMYKDAPILRIEDMKKLVSGELYEMHIKFIHSMKELNVDEPVMMLLMLIVLFSSERPGLVAAPAIQAHQEHYLHLLRIYMEWRYGEHNTSILYPKLLYKLTDLRELNDQHTEYNLKLAKQEVAEIQMQLGRLNLNPYTEWPNIMQIQQNFTAGMTNPLATLPVSDELLTQQTDSQIKSNSTAMQNKTQQPLSSLNQGNLNATDQNKGTAITTNPGSNISANPLASFDFDQLANNPSFQRMMMQQFQKSIMNVLSDANFGLGNLFPDGLSLQQTEVGNDPQQLQQQQQQQQLQHPSQQMHQQDRHATSILPSQQVNYQTQIQPTSQQQQVQRQQQQPSMSGKMADPSDDVSLRQTPTALMAQLDQLHSSQSSCSLNTPQHSQAFQQFEQLTGDAGNYNLFGDQSQQMMQQYHQHFQQQQQFHQQQQLHHQQQIQQQQQLSQQQIQQQLPQQQIQQQLKATQQQQHLMEHQQSMQETVTVLPKQEPVTPPPGFLQMVYPPAGNQSPPLSSPQDPLQQQYQCHAHQQKQHPSPVESSPVQSCQTQQYNAPIQGQAGVPTKRNSLTDASGLSQFRNMLEEFTTLNDPGHLEQVKQILGPDLVASLQQKLIASNNAPSQNLSHAQQHTPFQHTVTPQIPVTSTVSQQLHHQSDQSQLYTSQSGLQYFPGGMYPSHHTTDTPFTVCSSNYSPSSSSHTITSPANFASVCHSQHHNTGAALMANTVQQPAASFHTEESSAVMFQYPGGLNITPSPN